MMFFKDSREKDDPTSWRQRLEAITKLQASLKAEGYGPPRVIYATADGRHNDRRAVPPTMRR